MVDSIQGPRSRGTQTGLTWAGTLESTVAHLGASRPTVAWRLLLDRIRRSQRPLVLWLGQEANLDADARAELAAALQEGVRVSVIAEENRGLATALRWLGVDAEHFSPRQLSQVAAFLAITPSRLHDALHGLDTAA